MPEAVRTLAIIRPWRPGAFGILRITALGVACYYRIQEIGCEIGGRGWEVWRLGVAEPYHVRTGLSAANISCSCIGYEARGFCRHLQAMLSLQQRGLLEVDLVTSSSAGRLEIVAP